MIDRQASTARGIRAIRAVEAFLHGRADFPTAFETKSDTDSWRL
jgi:hypothetical protein